MPLVRTRSASRSRPSAPTGASAALRKGRGQRLAMGAAARIEAVETELGGDRERPLVLRPADAPVDLLELPVPADLARRVVLGHQVDVGARAELLGHEAEDRLRRPGD